MKNLSAAANRSRVPMNNHVALFLPSMRGGGAERVMMNLARDFDGRGLKVDLVLANAEGPYLKEVPQSVRVIDLRSPRVLHSLLRLVGYLRRERPDAMLSTMSNANVVALLARKLSCARVRVVVREANSLRLGESIRKHPRNRFIPLLRKWLYPSANGVVVLSASMANEVENELGREKAKITIIPNAANAKELEAKAKKNVDHPWLHDDSKHYPVVLAVGRLNAQKDFATLLHAFAELQTTQPSRLIILGEGEERTYLEELACQLGVADHVDMPGFISNPYAYMKRADVVVSSSRWEGSPNVVIEAISLGCHVVATDCPGGSRELLGNNKRGLLVSAGDSSGIAHAIGVTLRHDFRGKQNLPCVDIYAMEEKYLDLLLGPYGANRFVRKTEEL